LVVLVVLPGLLPGAQASGNLSPGKIVYQNTCSACHGYDGRGMAASTVGLELALPDFTACASFNKEPDADWFAVIHQGGPARGWSRVMPAFGEVLSQEQIDQVIRYVRGFCADRRWPRGDLNFPKALVTEKAFPEGEVYVLTSINARDGAALNAVTVYERRFGPLDQLEIKAPVGFLRNAAGTWVGGFGDVALGWKRVLFHSFEKGSIFSAAGELVLPSGNRSRDLGGGVKIFEGFAAYGQGLPADSHIQAQGGFEFPTDTEKAPRAAFWRVAAGKSFSQNGGFGRTWTPMVEIIADREFEEGAKTNWDVIPEFQVTLSRRQHIRANFGVRIPASNTTGRPVQLMFYLLWDFLDGGLREGW